MLGLNTSSASVRFCHRLHRQLKNRALEFLRTYAVVPRDVDGLQTLLMAFVDSVKQFKITPVFLRISREEDGPGWCQGHFTAPSLAAAEAMRQELISIAQQHLLVIKFEHAF